MVIIWGSTNAGKVDEVPGGMFHVMTQFGHLYYVPLIPTGSYVVLEQFGDGSFRGVPIPFSFKSILAGWIRGGSIVAMIGAVIGTLVLTLDAKAAPLTWIIPVLIGIGAVIALVLSYKLKFFTEASYERAIELARRVALNDIGLLMLEVTYGRMTAAQAELELARLEEQAARALGPEPLVAQVIE